MLSSAPRHVHLDGFDLHAHVAVPASDRTRLEQLCRYLLRPAVSQDRLRLTSDGRVLLALKTAWADGTRHLLFEPLELLEKLAALTPRPRINLTIYHGVLAPHARWRARVVASEGSPAPTSLPASPSEGDVTVELMHRHWSWANLMRRAFEIDVLACPKCGGRLRSIATVEDPERSVKSWPPSRSHASLRIARRRPASLSARIPPLTSTPHRPHGAGGFAEVCSNGSEPARARAHQVASRPRAAPEPRWLLTMPHLRCRKAAARGTAGSLSALSHRGFVTAVSWGIVTSSEKRPLCRFL